MGTTVATESTTASLMVGTPTVNGWTMTQSWVDATAARLGVETIWMASDWLPLLWRIEAEPERDRCVDEFAKLSAYMRPDNLAQALPVPEIDWHGIQTVLLP